MCRYILCELLSPLLRRIEVHAVSPKGSHGIYTQEISVPHVSLLNVDLLLLWLVGLPQLWNGNLQQAILKLSSDSVGINSDVLAVALKFDLAIKSANTAFTIYKVFLELLVTWAVDDTRHLEFGVVEIVVYTDIFFNGAGDGDVDDKAVWGVEKIYGGCEFLVVVRLVATATMSPAATVGTPAPWTVIVSAATETATTTASSGTEEHSWVRRWALSAGTEALVEHSSHCSPWVLAVPTPVAAPCTPLWALTAIA